MELFDRLLIVNEHHLRRVLTEYLLHYNTARLSPGFTGVLRDVAWRRHVTGSTDGTLYALDTATGTEQRRVDTGSAIVTGLVNEDSVLYFATAGDGAGVDTARRAGQRPMPRFGTPRRTAAC